MDFCRNVTVSTEYHQQEKVLASPPPCSKLGAAAAALTATTSPLDDPFSAQNTEVDFSSEWLSVFVEDCLSSTGNYLPAPTVEAQKPNTEENPPKNWQRKPQDQEDPSSLKKLVIPGKSRSKRRRLPGDKTRNPLTSWCYTNQAFNNLTSSDPPLLQQTYWLADSELIMPIKEDSNNTDMDNEVQEESGVGVHDEDIGKVVAVVGSNGSKDSLGVLESNNGQQQPRRCTHCLAQRTPQWRAGPLGPKTLCNACGVRYKSGRLLPEYRPAKSPTFVSYLHSNSHKKVMEMRMAGFNT
uniref:GATA-type domain-containing protein n=1 Tax=Populus trichocarpa TaxID=3694 RepID=A0A2K1Y1N9_POPTR|eukprot:XP_002319169.3 GATA transcription factor 2 [Populus trichocarpa]